MVCQERRGAPQMVVGCPEEREVPQMVLGFLLRILMAMVCLEEWCEVVRLEEKMVGLGMEEDWS